MHNEICRSVDSIDREIEKLKKERFQLQMKIHQKKLPFYELELQEKRFLLEETLKTLGDIEKRFLQIIDCIEGYIPEERLIDGAKNIRRNTNLIHEVCDLQIEEIKNYVIRYTDLKRNCSNRGDQKGYAR